MLHVGCWWWNVSPNPKYDESYVRKLEAGVRRHLKQEFVWHVFSVEPEDQHWLAQKGCFARIRTFDPEWQKRQGIYAGDRLVILDLDVIITGPLDDLFDRSEPFVILTGANAQNPCPTNGSAWMLHAGTNVHVFDNLTLDAVDKMPRYDYADDQEWFLIQMPDYGGWKVGEESGIYCYGKPGWPPKSQALPSAARIVAFPGFRDPSQFQHLPWVKQHWIE